jgi:hypothetical protein
MRALLNSLGLTLWSSIAIVLAVGLALVGYRLSSSMKDSVATMSPPTARVASPSSRNSATSRQRGARLRA